MYGPAVLELRVHWTRRSELRQDYAGCKNLISGYFYSPAGVHQGYKVCIDSSMLDE